MSKSNLQAINHYESNPKIFRALFILNEPGLDNPSMRDPFIQPKPLQGFERMAIIGLLRFFHYLEGQNEEPRRGKQEARGGTGFW